MNKTFLITSALLLGASASAHARTADELIAAGTPEQKGQAIVEELGRRNTGWHDFAGEVEMDLEDAAGGKARRDFTVKVLEKPSAADGDRSLIVFSSPADLKGTAVLSHAHGGGEDEQWLFLPSSRRTKRISTGNRSGSFVGSEFSFEDLTASDPRKYAWRYVAKETCDGQPCLVLVATPKEASSAYSRRVVRVDAAQLRVVSVELYDRKGDKLKTLTYRDYQQLDGYWRARAWSMKNAQSGKGTTLRFVKMKLRSGYGNSDFAPEKLGN
jgi:hypothetical protein